MRYVTEMNVEVVPGNRGWLLARSSLDLMRVNPLLATEQELALGFEFGMCAALGYRASHVMVREVD